MTEAKLKVQCPACGSIASGGAGVTQKDMRCPKCKEVVRFKDISGPMPPVALPEPQPLSGPNKPVSKPNKPVSGPNKPVSGPNARVRRGGGDSDAGGPVCPKCQGRLRKGSRSCRKCGIDVTTGETIKKRGGQSNAFPILVAIVIALIAIGGLVYYFMTKSS